jgi:hypothetical protein
MSASVFTAIRLRNRRTPIRKYMSSKYLYLRRFQRAACIFAVPSASEIAPEPR